MLPPTALTPVPVRRRVAGMKQILLMIAVVALVGCGKSLDERIVGAWGESPEELWVFEPNGVVYGWTREGGKESFVGKGKPDFIWVVVEDKEVHIIHPAAQDDYKNGDRKGVVYYARLEGGEGEQGDKLIISYEGRTETVGTKITLHSEHPLYKKLKK